MKKSVVITVIFMIITGTVCAPDKLDAQDLKFDGYIESGLGVWSTNDENQDTLVKAFAVDSERDGYRFRFNGIYQNEEKNAGARFRFQSQGRMDTAGYFSLPYAYGWVTFLNNIFNLAGGIIDDSAYTTADWWFNDDSGEGLGLLLKINPVTGLSLGIGSYVISQQSSGSNNILQTGSGLPNFGNIRLKPDEVKYTFNAAYTLADAFRIGAGFRPKNNAGWNDGQETNTGREETSQLTGELRLLAVKDLTAVIIGILNKLDEFRDNGDITLSETFAYRINREFTLGFNAVQFFYNRPADKNPAFLFYLWGSYAFGKIVPRLDLAYFINGRSNTTTSSAVYHRRGFTPGDDLSVFSIRPSIKINLDSKTFLEIGDVINLDSSKNDIYHSNTKNSMCSNVFYIDMKWSF
ncbi:MAG: hypothetical protein LBH16_04490 [Treponema sp.]|nr:hypothetical protein [Treponema sp.]